MKYEQPYGITDTNAPYINGNPSTGTMGSIPPAASIEFPQREVVEVVSRANVRGYIDFNGASCAPPTDADLQQLRKAIEGFIRSGGFWDVIDTHVTYTVHGPGAKFPDLVAAMEYLSHYKITPNGEVKLQVHGSTAAPSEKLIYTTNLKFDHPNNDRIVVVGAPMLAPLPKNDTNYTLTGNDAASRASNTATNLALLRTKFATELFFAGGRGIEIAGTQLRAFDGFLITSDGQIDPIANCNGTGVRFSGGSGNAAITCYPYGGGGGGFPYLAGLAVVGFGNAGYCMEYGGMIANYGATWISMGNGQFGFYLCNTSTICTWDATLNAMSNGGSGFGMFSNSCIQADGAANWLVSAYNGMDGFSLAYSCIEWGGGSCTAKNNKNHQVLANWNSVFMAPTTMYLVGATELLYAGEQSSIHMPGGPVQCSPAWGTLGNNASYIGN